MIKKADYLLALELIDNYHRECDKEAIIALIKKVVVVEPKKVEKVQETSPKVTQTTILEPTRTEKQLLRVKVLTEHGFKENVTDKQFVKSGIGIGTAFVETTDDVSFNDAIDALEVNIASHQAKMDTKVVQMTPQPSPPTKQISNATLSAKVMSEEEIEMQEDIFSQAIPVSQKTIEEAFPEPPTPPISGLEDVADGMGEQMKKNAGQPYRNKLGKIVGDFEEENGDPTREEMWERFTKLCAEYKIPYDGITWENQDDDGGSLRELNEYVDGVIAKIK